jgi:hypothetical protein
MAKTWWKDGKKVDPEIAIQHFGDNAYQSGNIAGRDNNIGGHIETSVIGVEDVMDYLSTKGCTLWVNWDISSEEGLQKAAEWLTNEIYNVLLYVSNGDEE